MPLTCRSYSLASGSPNRNCSLLTEPPDSYFRNCSALPEASDSCPRCCGSLPEASDCPTRSCGWLPKASGSQPRNCRSLHFNELDINLFQGVGSLGKWSFHTTYRMRSISSEIFGRIAPRVSSPVMR